MVISFREYVKNYIIPLGLIITLIVGIVLRFKGLTFQSYWIDELFSVTVSNPSNSFSYMYDRTVTDVHPLYINLYYGDGIIFLALMSFQEDQYPPLLGQSEFLLFIYSVKNFLIKK